MKIFKFISLFFLAILFLGCGKTRAGDKRESLSIVSSKNIIYVSQKDGLNSPNRGTSSAPFKTISYALKNITGDILFEKNIYIKGGNYNYTNGETFPLTISNHINLMKWEDNRSLNIEANDENIAIILKGDNRLIGLNLSSLNSSAILSENGNNTLVSITISNSKNGVGLLNNSNLTLIDSEIKNSSHSGIEVSNNAKITLQNTKIINSNIGIYISDKGTIESYNSKIIDNKKCDFLTNGSENLNLQGVAWDSNISDFSIETSCSDGNNIVNIGEGTILYQPTPHNEETDANRSEISISNDLLFSNAKNEIKILSPKFNDTIYSTTPTLKYNNTNLSKYIMVLLWKNIPIVNDEEIANPEDIVWYWHTGMKDAPIGIIEYDKGGTPIDGDINPTSITPPTDLKRGRTYYYTVWEWDEDGIEILSSSHISYFTVAP